MDDCSDPILIGFPDLLQFNFGLYEDEDGVAWAGFGRLGISMLVNVPTYEPGRSGTFHATEPRVLEGHLRSPGV